MRKIPSPPTPKQQPAKQVVRNWLIERSAKRLAPPDRNQIRRMLEWELL